MSVEKLFGIIIRKNFQFFKNIGHKSVFKDKITAEVFLVKSTQITK